MKRISFSKKEKGKNKAKFSFQIFYFFTLSLSFLLACFDARTMRLLRPTRICLLMKDEHRQREREREEKDRNCY